MEKDEKILNFAIVPVPGQVKVWQVRMKESTVTLSQNVTTENGEPHCDCSVFTFGGDCDHARWLTENTTYFVASLDGYGRRQKKAQPLLPGEIGIEQIGSGELRKLNVIDPNVSRKTLADMVGGLATGLSSGAKQKINAEEIAASLDAASVRNVKLGDPIVKKAGREAYEKWEKNNVDTTPTGEVPPWMTVPLPEDFFVEEANWRALLYTMMAGKNALLIGPSGSGKTELVGKAGHSLAVPVERFNFGAMTEPRLTLIGSTHFAKDKGTWFNPSRFVRAVQGGPDGPDDPMVVLADELTRADRDAFNYLFPLLDTQRYLAIDEDPGTPVVRRGKNVAIVGTANVGAEYTGTTELDWALRDRQNVILELDFPPPDAEESILRKRCKGLPKNVAALLVRIATDQRRLAAEGDFDVMVSTRVNLEAGELMAAGMGMLDAYRVAALNHFSSEGGEQSERAKLLQILQKYNVR